MERERSAERERSGERNGAESAAGVTEIGWTLERLFRRSRSAHMLWRCSDVSLQRTKDKQKQSQKQTEVQRKSA